MLPDETRKNGRYTNKVSSETCPYVNLAIDIIIDAIHIVRGSPASDKDRQEAIYWLRSETCKRWAAIAGVDIQIAFDHKDSLVKVEKG